MKRTIVMIAAMALCAAYLLAQAPPAAKPGPEHQKLSSFVGNWTFDGEAKPGPMGPGGKLTGTEKIQWMPGGFFLERRFEGKGPGGEMKGVEIMGYDPGKKSYIYHYFDSMGSVGSGTMTVTGNTWTATGTGNMAGKTLLERCSLAFGTGGGAMNIKCEGSADGKSWMPTFEGKATKSKS